MEKWTTMKHCGGLKEALETEQKISEKVAKKLIKEKIYTYYGYDKRIKAERYLIEDIPNNLGLPQWINRYK